MQDRARPPHHRAAGAGGRARRAVARGRPLSRAAVAAACAAWGAEIDSWAGADYSAVAFVRLADGRAAVAAKRPDAGHEAEALALWDGEGAVRLLDRSDDGVLLLERASPGWATTSDAVLGAALARLWVVPPAGAPFRRFDDAVVGWRRSLVRWRSTIGPVAVDAALAASDGDLEPRTWRLLHGDGHHGNVIDGGPGRGWVAIDPQPLVGPPGFDVAPALWNGPDDAGDVEARIAVLASSSGLAPGPIRRWARFRSALSVAWFLDDGVPLGPTGWRSLAAARELATTVPEP